MKMNDEIEILYVSFNQDSSCFAVGTDYGFHIFSSVPFKLNLERILNNGVGIVEMLFRSNVIALRGGGKNNNYSLNSLLLWNDEEEKIYKEIKLDSEINSVKLKKDMIFISTIDKLYVYSLLELNILDTIKLNEESKGVMAVSNDYHISVLAYPERLLGHIRIKSYENSLNTLIKAQNSVISCISLNNVGNIVATSSIKGIFIKVFCCESGVKLMKVIRGSDVAEIFSISFNYMNDMFAVSSNKGTIHIYSLCSVISKVPQLKNNHFERKNIPENKKNFFGNIYGFSKFRLPDSKPFCTFGPEDTLMGNRYLKIVISEDGNYYRALINFDGTECSKLEEYKIID